MWYTVHVIESIVHIKDSRCRTCIGKVWLHFLNSACVMFRSFNLRYGVRTACRDESSIKQDERHVLVLALASLFFSMEEAEIERLLRRDDKHLQELSQLMTAAAWKGIIDAFPYMKEQAQLLTGGEIRKECSRLLGEITSCKKHLPESQRTDVRMLSKLKFVEDTYKKRHVALGKRKDVPSAVGPDGLPKAPRVTAQ